MSSAKVSSDTFEHLWNKALNDGWPLTRLQQELGYATPRELQRRAERLRKQGMHLPPFKERPPVESKPAPIDTDVLRLRNEIQRLRSQLHETEKQVVDTQYIKARVLQISSAPPSPPTWLVKHTPSRGTTGVPTLLASDWHFGEVVDPKQINGVNSYNMAIAKERARRLITKTIDLLQHHMVKPDYPGIVFALAGDLMSGGIHDELAATDDDLTMPTILEVFNALIWCIDTLAGTFKRVFVPCVTGNHGRATKKIWQKGRTHTSYEWLIYHMLAKHFESDERVQFLIPDGPDCLYSVFGVSYLLTHGDQFRGGDGLIGALGPLTRGRHKKFSRNTSINMHADVMVCGHFHQLMQLEHLIVNGSLIGYSEYAFNSNFGYEPARQALWLTHPAHGVTFHLPVLVQDVEDRSAAAWVSWQ